MYSQFVHKAQLKLTEMLKLCSNFSFGSQEIQEIHTERMENVYCMEKVQTCCEGHNGHHHHMMHRVHKLNRTLGMCTSYKGRVLVQRYTVVA